MKEVLMTTRAILVPVAAALVLAACREPASPASSSSLSTRPAFAVGSGQSGLRLDPGGLEPQAGLPATDGKRRPGGQRTGGSWRRRLATGREHQRGRNRDED